MRFMLLVKATRDFEEGILPDEKMLSEMATYTEELVKAGAKVGCERLQPSSMGTRVHYAKGKFTVTDGPFTETKELIAGFSMIEAKSLDVHYQPIVSSDGARIVGAEALLRWTHPVRGAIPANPPGRRRHRGASPRVRGTAASAEARA